VTITLEWTPGVVRVDAAISGDYALPYRDIRVILPERDTREVKFGGPIGLARNRL
jgi:hypothetical protein